jgi:hypothetical protein
MGNLIMGGGDVEERRHQFLQEWGTLCVRCHPLFIEGKRAFW